MQTAMLLIWDVVSPAPIKYPANLALNPRLRRDGEAENTGITERDGRVTALSTSGFFVGRTIDGDFAPEICQTNYFRFSGRSWSMVVEHLDQTMIFDGACGKDGHRRVMACTRI